MRKLVQIILAPWIWDCHASQWTAILGKNSEAMYDVVVIGARCAGSPVAMLLARKGYRVALLDKSAFPSDTISTHIVFPRGMEKLRKWGLLDAVLETGCRLNTMAMVMGPLTLSGQPTSYEGIRDVIAPRRHLLDNILLEGAIRAGVHVREECLVQDLIREDERVIGVRYRTQGGSIDEVRARIVIGADGKNSMIARLTKADEYQVTPPMTCWYYTYWSGLDMSSIEFQLMPGRAIGFIPTNDNLVCIPVVSPQSEFHAFRADIEGNYLAALQSVPMIAERMRTAHREERYYGMAHLPGFYRQGFGPGWALVGDAGYHRDPMTGQGISDALVSADMLARAIDLGFSGQVSLELALLEYVRERDTSTAPMYRLTAEWASLQPPPPEMQQLLNAMQGNPAAIGDFFGAVSGGIPLPQFFAPGNIQRMMGEAVVHG